MITFAVWQLVQLVALVALGYAAYKIYKRFDDRVEKRRLAAFDVATELSKRGLKRLPRMLRCYAIGDYSGLAHEIRKFVEGIEEGVPVVAQEFEKVFDSILAETLKTENGRTLVQAKLDASMIQPTEPTLSIVV